MNELDEANLDKQLREKMEPFGRHPSGAVWDKINQRINQPAAPAAPVRPWVWVAVFMGGLLLLLIGNMMPSLIPSDKTVALTQTDATQTATAQTAAEVTPANPAETAHALPSAGSTGAGKPETVAAGPEATTGNITGQVKNTGRYSGRMPMQAPARAQQETAVLGGFTEANLPQTSVSAAPPVIAQTAVEAPAEKPASETPVNAVLGSAQTMSEPGKVSSAGTQVPAVLQTLVSLETNLQPLLASNPETAESRNQAAENLQAQIAELTKLKTRADSLLKAVQDPEYLKPLPVASHKTDFPNNARSRWSAALAFAPERSFLNLRAPATDSLMELREKHESGRSGYNASVMVDYQLNDRLSVGAGVGVSSYGLELPVTEWETQIHVTHDTTEVTSYQVGSTTSEIITVRTDTVYQLEPVLNNNGQVLYYDSIPIVSYDTTTFIVTQYDSLETITQTITPLVSKTEVATYKVLKTEYNFFTLPVNLRYRLTPGARCWADVGIGAQLQLFRGGSQVVTRDGHHYETRKISTKDGPFRPINLALMGNLALNYALSPRLSVSVAPAVRWQTMSVYKKETGLKQQPFATGLQFGIRFAL